MLATHAIHLLPSVNPIPTVFFKGKKEGMADESTKSLIRAYGTAKGQQFIILFDMGSFEDAISLQLARNVMQLGSASFGSGQFYTRTPHVRKALQLLRDHSLYINAKKSAFELLEI